MNKLNHFYEPHLAVREISVLPGGEWIPRISGWSMIQVEDGTGYWLQAPSSIELEVGTILVVAGNGLGRIRASQLNGLALRCFNVMPSRLTGLITLGEQDFLRRAASKQEAACRVFSAHSPMALKMTELCADRSLGGIALRLKLLQLFVEAFAVQWEQTAPGRLNADARERLQLFLKENPPDALLEISFKELAEMTHCTSRHLSRIFYDLVGMSFRDKRAEIRLARARDLLVTSKSKVVEVALESGFKSLSLFNLMFTRRFGTSPGRWRQKHGVNGGNGVQRGGKRGNLRFMENSKQSFYSLG